MKINHGISLMALGAVLSAINAEAQTTTGSGTINNSSSTYPQDAVVTDSLPQGRTNNRNTGRNRKDRGNSVGNQNSRTNSGSSTGGVDKDRYQQSSSANGTTVNSSNTTNYNTNNATNPPTGVGSTPTTADNPAVVPGQQISNGQNNSPSRGSVGNSSESVPSGNTSTGSGSSSGSSSSGSSSGSSTTTTPPGTSASTSGTTTNRQLSTTPGATGTGMAVAGNANESNPASAPGGTPNESVGDFVASAPNYLTLQNALQSTNLDKTLMDKGPFTVFAPSNDAFKKLPIKTQNTLLQGQNQETLKSLLSYHVLQGTVDSKELARQINAGSGKAQLKTLAGGTLTAQIGSDGRVMLTDEQGGVAYVSAADKYQSNGVIHGIDKVLLPKGMATAFK